MRTQQSARSDYREPQSGANVAPQVGEPAPDAMVTNSDGNSVSLSSFWSQKPTVLVFLRHFGCPFCREQISQLREGYSKIVDAGGGVVCIGMGPYTAGKAFSIYYNLPFPVVVSPEDLRVYSDYGLNKGTLKQLFGLSVLLRGLVALRHGVGPVEGDPNQMPGVFVVGTDGELIFEHRAAHQADYVSIDRLTTEMRNYIAQRG